MHSGTPLPLGLSQVPGVWWIHRFDRKDAALALSTIGAFASSAAGTFASLTLTADECSAILPDKVPGTVLAPEGPWGLYRVDGTLDFALTGIMARITRPLAEAGISIFTTSTYDTDYILVAETDLTRAADVLTAAGIPTRSIS